jgi:mannose-6-phosphate isomerase-like protein (cupin superfamily)
MRITSRFVRQSALVMGTLTLMISTPGQTQTETAKASAPTLHSSSQVSDAPGKGILPMISGHMAAGLSLYHLDAQPIEQVSALIQRQYLHGSQSTFSKWIMKKGAVVPLHHHANEQITWITQGEAEVYSQGKEYVMHAGDIMIIPPTFRTSSGSSRIRSISISSRRRRRPSAPWLSLKDGFGVRNFQPLSPAKRSPIASL